MHSALNTYDSHARIYGAVFASVPKSDLCHWPQEKKKDKLTAQELRLSEDLHF